MPSPFYVYRVLVVDDSPVPLRTLRRQLEDEGFYVRTASNIDEALALMQEDRFHVAVVDLRLDELDAENQDGLKLMEQLRLLDPTLAVIILTGYANVPAIRKALQPNNVPTDSGFFLWQSPAYKFLEKNSSDLRELPQTIREAFRAVVCANLALQIHYPPDFEEKVVRRIGFVALSAPQIEQLQSEIDELLRKMFADWDTLQIEPVTSDYSGYSRAVVFKVMPEDERRGPGETIVAKIGECPLVEREIQRYRTLIRGVAPFVPTAMEPAWRTRTLGGIVYTYAGLGGVVRDFAEYFHASTPDQIGRVVDNLFRRTLAWQTRYDMPTRRDADLRAVFMNLLRLREAELVERRDELTAADSPLQRDSSGLRMRQDDGSWLALPDPVAYMLSASMMGDYGEITAHGDLHIHNVLIDEQDNAWLIDFANADLAPLYYDHAFFEMSLRIELVETGDVYTLYRWIQMLNSDNIPPMPDDLTTDATLVKAHQAITAIRQQALRGRQGEAAWRVYRLALCFVALRLTTVKFLLPEPGRRRHALLAAALLAQGLGAGSGTA
jgi:CheY-like chemotaxis protein